MKTISELNDQILLGKSGLSKRPPRIAARAILQNNDGLYAVMYAKKFNLYTLPGGGVFKGESVIAALKREIKEETGSTCEDIEELGIVYENRACHNFTQENHYFTAKASKMGKAALTKKEAFVGARVEWHTFDELYALIALPKHKTEQRKYIQARDLSAIREYQKILKDKTDL